MAAGPNPLCRGTQSSGWLAVSMCNDFCHGCSCTDRVWFAWCGFWTISQHIVLSACSLLWCLSSLWVMFPNPVAWLSLVSDWQAPGTGGGVQLLSPSFMLTSLLTVSSRPSSRPPSALLRSQTVHWGCLFNCPLPSKDCLQISQLAFLEQQINRSLIR